jgi:hypothetical protein
MLPTDGDIEVIDMREEGDGLQGVSLGTQDPRPSPTGPAAGSVASRERPGAVGIPLQICIQGVSERFFNNKYRIDLYIENIYCNPSLSAAPCEI